MSRNRGLVNGSTAEARFGELKRQIWAVDFCWATSMVETMFWSDKTSELMKH